jgi:uncharacterized protein (TIGR02145 family)
MSTENLWKSYNGKGFDAKHSDYAERSTSDENGNVITTTYATKSELATKADESEIPANYVESASVSGSTLTLTPNSGSPVVFTADTGTWGYSNYPIPPEKVTIGGRTYPYVKIGNQLWLAENLDLRWDGLDFGSNTAYDSKSTANYLDNREDLYGPAGRKYGLLYNVMAVDYIESNKNALSIPEGWRVSTKADWETLIEYAGGETAALTVLKSTSYWTDGSSNTDTYGLSLYPSGMRNDSATFYSNDEFAGFWTSTGSQRYCVRFAPATPIRLTTDLQSREYAVRLVKDATF